jgi:MYXO-CTERM domain-containing protein
VRGSPCTDPSQCADGICTRGVCCDTPCDGLCQICTADGCVGTPGSDARCGQATCGPLSTQCRTYNSQKASLCVEFGQCVEGSTLADCDQAKDQPDNTPCVSPACANGQALCRTGECVCADEMPPPKPMRPVPGCACAVGGSARPNGAPLAALLLAAALSTWRRSRRR